MTPEEQRIAIAEACGWEQPPPLSTLCGWKDSAGIAMLSDPLNDLNAMHEAEHIEAIRHSISLYAINLEFIVHRDSKTAVTLDHPIITRFCIFATAAQRAEAFLRCIGKWKD